MRAQLTKIDRNIDKTLFMNEMVTEFVLKISSSHDEFLSTKSSPLMAAYRFKYAFMIF